MSERHPFIYGFVLGFSLGLVIVAMTIILVGR